MISLMLVEDHAAVTRTFTRYFKKQPDLEVRVTVDSAEEALQWFARQEAPEDAVDVVLVDLSLPGMNGIALVEALHENYPAVACLVLSGYRDGHYVQRALDAGARGYIAKDDVYSLGAAIQRVMDGEIYLSDALDL